MLCYGAEYSHLGSLSFLSSSVIGGLFVEILKIVWVGNVPSHSLLLLLTHLYGIKFINVCVTRVFSARHVRAVLRARTNVLRICMDGKCIFEGKPVCH